MFALLWKAETVDGMMDEETKGESLNVLTMCSIEFSKAITLSLKKSSSSLMFSGKCMFVVVSFKWSYRVSTIIVVDGKVNLKQGIVEILFLPSLMYLFLRMFQIFGNNKYFETMKLPLLDWKKLLLQPSSLAALKDNVKRRGVIGLDVDKLHSLYVGRTKLMSLINGKRSLRDPSSGPLLKIEIKKLTEELFVSDNQLLDMSLLIPNDLHPSTPLFENRTVREWGGISCDVNLSKDKPTFKDLVDFQSSKEVVGAGFPVLKGKIALLEIALVNYVIKKLIKKGYQLSLPPDLVKEDLIRRCGYVPRSTEKDGIFRIKDSSLALSGTSEILLASLNSEKIFTPPFDVKREVAVSHCFRDEATGGSNSLYRVRQFTKVEMFITSKSGTTGLLDEITSLQREILEPFKRLRCRQIIVKAGDLGSSATMKYDTEVYLPSMCGWGELMSASDCTDYQARRLRIRYRDGTTNYYCHTYNGTAIAVPRMIQSIAECYTNADGTITIPSILKEFMLDGSDVIG